MGWNLEGGNQRGGAELLAIAPVRVSCSRLRVTACVRTIQREDRRAELRPRQVIGKGSYGKADAATHQI